MKENEEREANYFAMCLLMPEPFVRDWIEKFGPLDLTSDEKLARLAKDFCVSHTLAAARLGQLGILTGGEL